LKKKEKDDLPLVSLMLWSTVVYSLQAQLKSQSKPGPARGGVKRKSRQNDSDGDDDDFKVSPHYQLMVVVMLTISATVYSQPRR